MSKLALVAKAIDQEAYERIFQAASELVFAGELSPEDAISSALGATLFALLNAWEKESVHEDSLRPVIEQAEKLAVAYELFRMEVLGQ